MVYLGHTAVHSNYPIHSDPQMTAQCALEQALMEVSALPKTNES